MKSISLKFRENLKLLIFVSGPVDNQEDQIYVLPEPKGENGAKWQVEKRPKTWTATKCNQVKTVLISNRGYYYYFK